jgi:hypothetical protein
MSAGVSRGVVVMERFLPSFYADENPFTTEDTESTEKGFSGL